MISEVLKRLIWNCYNCIGYEETAAHIIQGNLIVKAGSSHPSMAPHWSARHGNARRSVHSVHPKLQHRVLAGSPAEPCTEPGREERLQNQTNRYKGERTRESSALSRVRNAPVHDENIYRFLYPPLFFSIALISQVY